MKRKDFSIFQQFVPSTDIDGIDAKPEVLSWLSNFKIGNGFLQSYPSPTSLTLSTNVATSVANGYEIIAGTSFYHSKQGEVLVIILWKETAPDTEKLKVFVNDENLTGHLYWGGAITNFIEKPKNVNFHLVNDELKINLNCEATTTLTSPTILNLSLIYLEEVKYVENNNNLVRPAGWYLRPRWLGMTCANYNSPIVFVPNYYFRPFGTTPKSWTEDFQDEEYIPHLNFDNLPANYGGAGRVEYRTGKWGIGAENGNNSDTNIHFFVGFRIDNLRNVGKINFSYIARGTPAYDMHIEIKVNETDSPESKAQTIYKKEFQAEVSHLEFEVEQEVILNKISTKSFYLLFLIHVPPKVVIGNRYVANSLVLIDNLTLTASDGVIIGKYRNKQRALLTITGDSPEEGTLLGVYGVGNIAPPHVYRDLYLYVARNRIEYDIEEYEIYFKNLNDNLYYKKLYVKVDGQWNVDSLNPTTLIWKYLDVMKEDEVETLNFNYGLGLVRVDNQFLIFSEAVLSGRIYAITNSYKIRMTHIAGNGAIQPDSFPYDEDKNFGYIEESKNVKLESALILNENNLAFIARNGISVYSVYSNRGILSKVLRISFQDYTEFNPKSLTKTVTGISPLPGFFFVTNEGIWFHTGEVGGIPKNLIAGRLDNFWRTMADKKGIGFYVPATKEYWYQINSLELLVYETLYDSFRIQTKPSTSEITSACLVDKDIVFFTKNSIYTWKVDNSSFNIAGFTTHKFDLGSPYTNKILHSFEVLLKREAGESLESFTVFVYVTVDDNKTYNFQFNSREKRLIRFFPLSVRCNTVQVSILVPALSYSVKISQFVIFYTEDGNMQGLSGSPNEHLTISSIGAYGRNYGRDYIIM